MCPGFGVARLGVLNSEVFLGGNCLHVQCPTERRPSLVYQVQLCLRDESLSSEYYEVACEFIHDDNNTMVQFAPFDARNSPTVVRSHS